MKTNLTDFEIVFALVRDTGTVFTLNDLPGAWHELIVDTRLTNAARILLPHSTYTFTPEGKLAGAR